MRSWTTRPMMVVAALVAALLVVAFYVSTRADQRTVTAHFDRAVAVYPGTDLRVMGVQIGEVTAVVPDGNSVRVEMRYDSEYDLPADAEAAVVTPTLVADRYVQVFPPYGGGEALADDAVIPLERTQTPVELDRMFRALDDLSVSLGPAEGQSSGGALADVLAAGARALEGNGELGGQTIRNLSAVAETLAENEGPLFDNVRALASITETLAANDTTVEAFMEDLAGVSSQFAGEREELATVVESLARVLGTVEGFIAENREVLGDDIESLASVLERVERQKDAIGLVTQKGALAMGNLAVAFEPGTGTYGSRLQVAPGLSFRPDEFVCQTLSGITGVPDAPLTPVCDLLGLLFGDAGGDPGATPESAANEPVGPVLGLTVPDLGSADPLEDWRDLLLGGLS